MKLAPSRGGRGDVDEQVGSRTGQQRAAACAAAVLRSAAASPPGWTCSRRSALEVGCGSGYGTRLILDQFGAAKVDAVDLDPTAVAAARRRLARYGDRVRLATGSATDLRDALGAEDNSYDAVFDFAILHHVEDWRAAVGEVARVLRSGGRFYFDEVTATALGRPSYQRLFDHPGEDRFIAGEFLAELTSRGLQVGERWRTRVGGDYLLGVAVWGNGDPADGIRER